MEGQHPKSNPEAVFSVEEVAKHNTKDDCWVIIHGFVCDVTNYLIHHPGGDKLVLKYAGKLPLSVEA